MAISIEAVYEEGVLRLSQPIPLAEGTRVEVIVISTEAKPKVQSAKDILAKIASMPLEGSNDRFSGRDHDSILYPQHDAI